MPEVQSKIQSETVRFEKRLLKEERAAETAYKNLLSRFDGNSEMLDTIHKLVSRHEATANLLERLIRNYGESPEVEPGYDDRWPARLKKIESIDSPGLVLGELRKAENHEMREYEDAVKNLMLSDELQQLILNAVLKIKRSNLRDIEDLSQKWEAAGSA
jgi:hypothetical protein